MRLNLVGPFHVNHPFGTEIAFSKGLKQLGVDVNEWDPNTEHGHVDPGADATLVFKNCCGKESCLDQHLRGPVIVYQPDDARFPHIMGMMLQMRRWSELFLSFDSHSTKIAKSMGYKVAEELLLTADPDLYSPGPEPQERDIDVSFIGSLSDPIAHASRRRMCKIVEAEADRRGWRFFYAECHDIHTVLDVYRRSKVVLNHATDVGQRFGTGFGLQCRHFEVGMTQTCLLSNTRLGLREPELLPFVQFFDEYSLVSQLVHLLEDDAWRQRGIELYEEINRTHMPVHRARQIIDFIEKHT